jgi:hypothetical protein
MKKKIISYEASLRKLHGEFERWFQDFKSIGLDLNVFSMPSNVDCELLKPSFQLELIELQCSTQLKQQFLNTSKLKFNKSLPKSSFPNFNVTPRESCPCLLPHICENKFFPAWSFEKAVLETDLTDGHLASVLRVTASQLEPDAKIIGHSIAVPLVTHSIIQRDKRSWKHQVSRNQGKLKYFIIFFIISLLFRLTMLLYKKIKLAHLTF